MLKTPPVVHGKKQCRGVAQPGSAPASGVGGRRFKSSRPDHFFPIEIKKLAPLSDWKVGLFRYPLRSDSGPWTRFLTAIGISATLRGDSGFDPIGCSFFLSSRRVRADSSAHSRLSSGSPVRRIGSGETPGRVGSEGRVLCDFNYGCLSKKKGPPVNPGDLFHLPVMTIVELEATAQTNHKILGIVLNLNTV